MLSAKGQMHDKMTALEIGADDYLAKPYERDALEARIRVLLKKTNSLRNCVQRSALQAPFIQAQAEA
jgi:DNA-binding response OmpR family regulator